MTSIHGRHKLLNDYYFLCTAFCVHCVLTNLAVLSVLSRTFASITPVVHVVEGKVCAFTLLVLLMRFSFEQPDICA